MGTQHIINDYKYYVTFQSQDRKKKTNIEENRRISKKATFKFTFTKIIYQYN